MSYGSQVGPRYPSAVFVAGVDRIDTGQMAVNQAGADFEGRFTATPKRLITGRATHVPIVGFEPPGVAVVDLVAAVITGLVEPVRQDGPIEVAVATHPAAWSDTQIAVLINAFERAGLPRPDTIPEPLAAAWRAVPATDRVRDGLYGIFDWGGGTFDAAVVRWTGDSFVLAGPTVGVDPLGGENIDDRLFDHVLTLLDADTLALLHAGDARARHQLWNLRRSVRETKEALSSLPSTTMLVASESVVITRLELEELASDLVDQCVTAMLDCFAAANTTPDSLAGIRLTGDASQLPLVRDRLWATIGHHLPEPRPVGEAKAAVALGALDAAHHTRDNRPDHSDIPDETASDEIAATTAASRPKEPMPTSSRADLHRADAPAGRPKANTTRTTQLVEHTPNLSIELDVLGRILAQQRGNVAMNPRYELGDAVLRAGTPTWDASITRFRIAAHGRINRAALRELVAQGLSCQVSMATEDRTGGHALGRAGLRIDGTGAGMSAGLIAQDSADGHGDSFVLSVSGHDTDGLFAAILAESAAQPSPPTTATSWRVGAKLRAPATARIQENLAVEAHNLSGPSGAVLILRAWRDSSLDKVSPSDACTAGLPCVITNQQTDRFPVQLASGGYVHCHSVVGVSTVNGTRVGVLSATLEQPGGGHAGVTVIRPAGGMKWQKPDPSALCRPFLSAIMLTT